MNRRIAVLMALSFVFLLSTQVFASPLDEELQKLKQAGIPTTIEELNLPEIPDSENGAVLYREADKLKNSLAQKYKKEWDYMPIEGIVNWDKCPAEEKKKVVDLVLHNPEVAKLYQLLEKATQMKCRLKTEEEKVPRGGPWITSDLGMFRSFTKTLAIKARIEAEYGDIDKALYAFLLGFRLYNLSNDPGSLSSVIRIANIAITLPDLENVLNKGEGDIKIYQSLIDEMKKEGESDLTSRGLMGDMVNYDLPWFSRVIKEGNKAFEFTEEDQKRIEKEYQHFPEKQRERFAELVRDQQKVLKEDYVKSGYKTPEEFFEKKEIDYLKIMSKIISLTEKPYWKGVGELKEIESEIEIQKQSGTLSRDLLIVYKRETTIDALFGAAELGLANRIYRTKHGKFADSLNQLTPEILLSLPLDPFTGKDYIYRKKDKGFIIYSLGDNLKDDGGIPQFSEQGKKGGYDIVWEDNGAETPIMIHRPVSLKSLKNDGSKELTIPPFSVPPEFPPYYSGLPIEEKTEGRSLVVSAVRELSAKVFESSYWNLTPDGNRTLFSGDSMPRYGKMLKLKDGYIFVYNVETEKTTRLAGTVSMVYDRKTGIWTVSGSIVPK